MLPLIDEWKFLAGLGIFLFGMFMMEESIKLLAGRSFKTMIRRYTGSRLKGLVTGILSTAILQSSSAVSLMVLAFVGAGLMTLINAIAVIFGAKVGTTVTAWIVALFGFKFKIEAFALPIIGIGGLGLILLGKSPRLANVSKLTVAFGFLFLGLDYMKISVEGFASSIDLASLPDLGLWVYVLAGLVMTAVMQSSSAAIAVILTTLFSGLIDFRTGAALVIGANIGTTVTILLGAIGGIPAKKRAALSSLLFSLVTASVVLLALPLVLWLVSDLFELADNAVMALALFHTLFNVTGVLVFLPLIPALAGFLEKLYPDKVTVLSRFILNTTPEVPEAAIAALRKEVLRQISLSIHYIAERYRIDMKNHPGGAGLPHAAKAPTDLPGPIGYADLERFHAEIFAFYAQVQAYELDEQEASQMEGIIRASRSTMNATKNFHELLGEIADIGKEEKTVMTASHAAFVTRLVRLRDVVDFVTRYPDDPETRGFLIRFFREVEEADKALIRSCAKAVAERNIREQEVTRLLMANRLFTQSSRMLILSMQALTEQAHTANPADQRRPADVS